METKEILKGLKFRLKGLKDCHSVICKESTSLSGSAWDYQTRIDEVESLINWIETKKGKTK